MAVDEERACDVLLDEHLVMGVLELEAQFAKRIEQIRRAREREALASVNLSLQDPPRRLLN